MRGIENLHGLQKGVIFASNHTSELDPILLPASLPFFSLYMPMFYPSRERSFYKRSSWRKAFYGGILFKVWGAHRVNSGQKNYEISLATHIDLLLSGHSIFIFPEGKKTDDGRIQNAHGGVIYLSEKSGAPIIPVGITGAYKLDPKSVFFRRRKVEVSFGEPIYAKDLLALARPSDEEKYHNAARIVMEKVRSLIVSPSLQKKSEYPILVSKGQAKHAN